MQRAYQTIDGHLINEECVSMFRPFRDGMYYCIKVITNFEHADDFIIFKGTKEEQMDIMQRLSYKNSFEDWLTLSDDSLLRMEHIKSTHVYSANGLFNIDMCLCDNQSITIFSGTEEGMKQKMEELKNSCYAIIYDLKTI